MSFIATTPTSLENKIILNNGFFPDIELKHARETMRIDGTVSATRLVEALTAAVLHANQVLSTWQQKQQQTGFETMTAIPAMQVDNKSALLHQYRRAIYSWAMADLAERYRYIDTSQAGQKHAHTLEETIDDHRRNARWALNDLMKISRSTVELI